MLRRHVAPATPWLALLAGVLAGCAVGPSRPTGPLPVYVWPPRGLAGAAPQRVAVLPFDDETGHPDAAEQLRQAFVAALTAAGRFDVIALDGQDVPADVEGTRRSGRSPDTLLLDLATRYGVGGVVFGTVTQLRAYGEPLVGLHVELLSTTNGSVLWSARGVLDAAEQNTVSHLRLYHDRKVADRPGSLDLESLQRSLSRFFTFAADVFVNTL